MAEYVTKEQVKEEILGWARCINKPERLVTEDTMYVIDALPPAEVRPVVLCRDCFANGLCSVQDALFDNDLDKEEDFYCANGRREEEDG